MDREYIIPNITEEEYGILEDNDVDWFPDDMFSVNHDAIICGTAEYQRAMTLLRRNQEGSE